MEHQQIVRILQGIAIILLGIAFSVSVSFVPFMPLAGLPIAVSGWWFITRTIRNTK